MVGPTRAGKELSRFSSGAAPPTTSTERHSSVLFFSLQLPQPLREMTD